MFESVKQSGQLNAMSYFTSLLVSIITHVLIICVMVSLPLIFYSPLSSYNPITWLIDSPVLSKQVPPPPQPSPSTPAAKAGSRPGGIIYEGPITPPERIPVGIPAPVEVPESGWLSRLGSGGGVGIGIQEPGDGFPIDDLIGKPVPAQQPPEPPVKPKLVQAVSELQESKLIFRVDPVYPEIAIRARVSGAVVLAAIINEEGSVTNLKVLSGHPLLIKAAVEAVGQWKYGPTILNGEPVSVSAVVTVVFRIQ